MFRSLIPRFAVVAGLLMCAVGATFTQEDDPRFDRAVPSPDQSIPSRPTGSVLVVTDETGFDNFDLGTTNAEPHMSTNPLNPLWFFNAFNTNSAWRTTDGNTWISSAPTFPSVAGDPVTAYDSLGNLYYETMKNPITGCWVVTSTNNGQTWSASVTSVAGVDKNWIAADQTMGPYANYVYTTMTRSGGGNFARSTDLGATWTNTFAPTTQSLPGMMVAVGPNVLGGNNISGGCVYVVTHSGSNAAGTYTFYNSTDGGLTFTLKSAQQFSNYIGTEVGGRSTVQFMRCRPYPFLAADNSFGPFRGRLYLVYASNNPSGNGNKSDIFLRYSTDQGGTWSSAVVVNDDANSQNNFQFHPAIWCDKETGRLYIKFYDTRRVPTSDSMDVYATYTDDGGATFAPNQRLTTAKFRINITNASTATYRGDYDAITSNRYTSMAVWTDFRNAPSPNYLGMTAYFPDFAMLVSPTADTLGFTDSLDAWVKVPAVKLYTHSVRFTASVSPSANISFSFPDGDSLTSYPDSIRLRIRLNNVPTGVYTVTVQGSGPNGTPVHRRTIRVTALGALVQLQQPNGGEQIFAGTTYPIIWQKNLVDTVRIEYSTNAGTSWILITPGTPARPIGSIHPKMQALGEEGDSPMMAAYNWLVPATPSTACLVRVLDKNNLTVGDTSNSTFTILATPAPRWTTQSTPVGAALYSVSVVDTLRAWAAGDSGRVLRTLNGGASWLISGSLTDPIYAIHAVDATRAFAASYAPGNARIQRTINGGLTWQTVYQNTDPNAFINAVWMFDVNNGYAQGDPIGGRWLLLRTSDGGATWTPRDTLLQAGSEAGWNNSMYWIGNQTGWFGTGNSRVYRTTNGGATWTSASTAFTNTFAVAFANGTIGLAGGNGSARSSNGGTTWANTPVQQPFFGIAPLNLSTPRFFGVQGPNVYKTSNHGTTYTVDFTGPGNYNHIDMKITTIGTNEWISGYAVGDNGLTSRYVELIAVTDVTAGSGTPREFALDQNYPNPFNPTTTITYHLPEAAVVSLRIFNVLGQEVATLVHGERPAGNYEEVWEGRSDAGAMVSSGVYFYRLEATSPGGSNVLSSFRKMVFMK